MSPAEKRLIYKALLFANWAAGEGLEPAESEGVEGPETFLLEYSMATDDEDWDTIATRLTGIAEPASN